MRFAILSLLVFTLICSCNSPDKSNSLLQTGNLPLQEYSIDITKDTVLVTKNGALLKIPKGSLTGEGTTAILEIQEAYSMQQMILAGLVTETDEQPLSSGGMIYIDAKAGQNLKITQPIKVALPADYLAKDMQLFKGQKDENGNIKWTKPAALPVNQQLNSLQTGETLFQSKCASCHAIGKDIAAPDLAHMIKRFGAIGEGTYQYYEHGFYPYKERYGTFDEYVFKKVVRDYQAYEHNGPFLQYKCNLIQRYRTAAPIMFNDTSSYDYVDDIFRYIQNESDRRKLPLPAHAYLKDCADSCVQYNLAVARLNKEKEKVRSEREKLAEENGALVEEERNIPIRPAISQPIDSVPPPVDFEERVSPNYYDAEYYQFSIESFGWYNIDILLKDMNGVEESELFVRITGEYREKLKVYLFIPSVKVYVEGGPVEDNNERFAFDLKNGKIPLPQNAQAYIMGVSETKESFAYVLKEFTTSRKQELEMSLTASSKEAFNAAIGQLNLEGISIQAKDAKNAAEIRKIDNEIKNFEKAVNDAQQLKPKNCDCDCLSPVPPESKAFPSDTAGTVSK